MPNNAKNAVVGSPLVSGGILVAPVGTALPTNEVTAPNVAFLSPGYAADTGVARSEKRDSDTKYAWGGDTLVIVQKSSTVTSKLGLAEYLNPVTQKLIYGDSKVTVTAATSAAGNKMTVAGSGAPTPHKSWIFEMFSGDARIRIVYPDAQITDLDDVEFKNDDISVRGIELTLFPDSAGNYFYEYSDDGRKTA